MHNLAAMLSLYKAEAAKTARGVNIELELRFKDVTRASFESLYAGIRADPEFGRGALECSINIISENILERGKDRPDDTQYIYKISFLRGVKSAESYMQKTKLARSVTMHDYIKYSVGISRETTIGKFSTSIGALVRFKVRLSFDYTAGNKPGVQGTPRWRFDLTAIKQGTLADLGPMMQTLRDGIFRPSLGVDNFLQELDYDLLTSFEVEIEHIGDAADLTVEDLGIVKKLYTLINPEYLGEIAYQEEIYNVAKYIVPADMLSRFKTPEYRLKKLSNQVTGLTKTAYYNEIYPPTGYYLTDKIDGIRCIISVSGDRCRFLTDTLREITVDTKFADQVADSEMVHRADGTYTLWLFDVICAEGKNVSGEAMSVRLGYLPVVCAVINHFLPPGCKAVPKQYVRLGENLEAEIREIFDAPREYKIDGLILSNPANSYYETKNYKWKPTSQITIDFLAIECPRMLLGVLPYIAIEGYRLHLLFVGVKRAQMNGLGMGFLPNYKSIFPDTRQHGDYFPIQFSPSIDPLAYLYYHKGDEVIDRRVIELARTGHWWNFVRIREDRKMERGYYGNDYRVAELNYTNYIDPFELSDLWSPRTGYFTKASTGIHVAPNKFKRFVISNLIRDNFTGAKWIIDLAAGRGADLHRYQECGVENALFIDIDPSAIAELIRRKFDYKAAMGRGKGWFAKRGGAEVSIPAYDRVHDIEFSKVIVKETKTLTIHTLITDLKIPTRELVDKTAQFGIRPGLIDGMMCNFAFHYLCDTCDHMRGILRFIAQMLRLGGVFIFITMDGRRIFELLRDVPVGGTWKALDPQSAAVKYAITKKYVGDRLSHAGQNIAVLLPFTNEAYEEPLCVIETVIAEAGKLGMECVHNQSLSTYMSSFQRADRVLYEALGDVDREYIDLFKYVMLRKAKEPPAKATKEAESKESKKQ